MQSFPLPPTPHTHTLKHAAACSAGELQRHAEAPPPAVPPVQGLPPPGPASAQAEPHAHFPLSPHLASARRAGWPSCRPHAAWHSADRCPRCAPPGTPAFPARSRRSGRLRARVKGRVGEPAIAMGSNNVQAHSARPDPLSDAIASPLRSLSACLICLRACCFSSLQLGSANAFAIVADVPHQKRAERPSRPHTRAAASPRRQRRSMRRVAHAGRSRAAGFGVKTGVSHAALGWIEEGGGLRCCITS